MVDFNFLYIIIYNMVTITRDRITIPKIEYLRLKKLDKRFQEFFTYIENLIDIKEARKEVKQGKIISQEKLFKQLGF